MISERQWIIIKMFMLLVSQYMIAKLISMNLDKRMPSEMESFARMFKDMHDVISEDRDINKAEKKDKKNPQIH